jgi:hypothetical protein
MSVDFRDVNIYPACKTFTASSSAGIATQVFIPNRVKQIQIGSSSGALYWSHTGDDGQAMPSTDRGFVPDSNLLLLRMGTGKERLDSIFISGQSGSEHVVVILEE